MSCSVLFKEFPLDHLEVCAEAVSRACGISLIDSHSKIRRGWGFLERNAAEPQALELVRKLAQHGVASVSMPNEQLQSPADPIVMVGFQTDAEGFTPAVQSTQVQAHPIRWSDVLIVAAGGFSEEVIRRQAAEGKSGAAKMIGLGVFLATGLPMGMFGGKQKQEKEVKKSRFVSFGEIVTRNLESFYFDPDHFNFAGLGDQKQLNASLNFRAMIGAFAGLSTARLNLGARLLLDQKALSTANYLRTNDFEAELQWLVNTILAGN